MSDFYITDICTSDQCPFFKFSNQCLSSNSQTDDQFSNLCPFLTFSNRHPMASLTYALTLTNKSVLDLIIWKGCWFENTLKSDSDWDNDVSGCQFEEWTPIWVQTLIWVYHIEQKSTYLTYATSSSFYLGRFLVQLIFKNTVKYLGH